MELVRCPVTGDQDFAPWIDAPDRFDLHGPSWAIVRSNASGLVLLNPRPEEHEAARHYPADDYDPFIHEGNPRSFRDRAYLAASSLLLGRKAAAVLGGLRKPCASTRILDIGCSGGRLLLYLHRRRNLPMENLFGMEPDSEARSAARAAGLTRVYGGLEEMPDACRFDRIVFWHSLEHIHRIGETLDAARRLLEPDGMLVVALPNIDSLDASFYGKEWVALDAPRHLYHFTPGTLNRLLALHGFAAAEAKPYHPDALYNAWYSEKLRCDRSGWGFGLRNAARAAAVSMASMLTGLNPDRSSGFICRAVSCGQEPLSAGEMRPSDFSSSADARR